MEENIRKARYAGSFYPKENKELSKMIERFLKNAKQKKIKGKLKGLLVPHAGYIYSGQVAAFAYKLLRKNENKVILFGPSHQIYLEGAFGFLGKWQTPIGEINVSSAQLPIVENDNEHSLEVQVPFLQYGCKDFTLMPIIYGEISPEELADIINSEMDDTSILIASSDLSHYLSYELAKKIDTETINAILDLDLQRFLQIGDACGKTGIAALIILAKKHKWKPILLDYKNSGDTAGDKKGVVGYAAIAFVDEKNF
jgi:AmmeMemoRadiSam system protein B